MTIIFDIKSGSKGFREKKNPKLGLGELGSLTITHFLPCDTSL
jgi:hypothetical protein